jgi:hypothetical protein
VSLATYDTAPPPRSSTTAPTPEAISVRVATQVTNPPSGGPPVVGSAVAVAVAVAVALAVAVAVAVAVGLAVALAVALGLAVALAVAVAVAVGLAMAEAEVYDGVALAWCGRCLAEAAGESSSTSIALTANKSKIFFMIMKHLL